MNVPRVEIEIRQAARQALGEALEAEPMDAPALVIQAPDPEECCRIGFDAFVVPKGEIPASGYSLVGEQEGLPVYLMDELTPQQRGRLVINLDEAGQDLVAIFLKSPA